MNQEIKILNSQDILGNIDFISELNSFIKELNNCIVKIEIANALLILYKRLINLEFCSFVERSEAGLNVINQIGGTENIKDVFDKEMSLHLYNWVIEKRKITTIQLAEEKKFVFIPLVDQNKNEAIEHGMLVFYFGNASDRLTKEYSSLMKVSSSIASLYMTKCLEKSDVKKLHEIEERTNIELKQVLEVENILAGNNETKKKILMNVIQSEKGRFNGNLWWASDLGSDITLVLTAQVCCNGLSSAMLSGYILGEMSALKSKAEISLSPKKVLSYLNEKLNPLFLKAGILINAWYGVFNIEAGKVRYASAAHPDPFVIGPEQQISNLVINSERRNKPLGQDLTTNYIEEISHIIPGSKLVICTSDVLDQIAKVGYKYDESWFPQVLETVGSLSLSEMKNSLESILSENSNGTANNASRLALLLEIKGK